MTAPKKMVYGNKPSDNGRLILSESEKINLLSNHQSAITLVKRYVGADDFLNLRVKRYCLWLKDVNKEQWKNIKEISDRVNDVYSFRRASSAKPTRDKASNPESFFFAPHTGRDYLLVPRVSSERRKYIPIGFMSAEVVASDANQIVPDATRYHFGILTSAIHMAWMRTVCGRLKSDYRYSASVVYNTFPWPNTTPQQEKVIEALAQAVLDTREQHPDKTLAQLYDPDLMPPELQEAHTALDMAVDRLYQAKPFADDEQRLQLLFKLYAELVAQKPTAPVTQVATPSDEEAEGNA